MDEPKKHKPPSDFGTHYPLPYVVRLRMVLGEDAVPQTIEVRVTAYSLMEAVLSAIMQSTGKADGVDYKIDNVAPDLPAYLGLLGSAVSDMVGGKAGGA